MPIRTPFQAIVPAALLLSLPDGSWADPADKKSALRGDAEKGRDLFNGKGVCHYCPGVDGFLNRRPSLAPDTKGVIDRLKPCTHESPLTRRPPSESRQGPIQCYS